jgi:hypothetical protein
MSQIPTTKIRWMGPVEGKPTRETYIAKGHALPLGEWVRIPTSVAAAMAHRQPGHKFEFDGEPPPAPLDNAAAALAQQGAARLAAGLGSDPRRAFQGIPVLPQALRRKLSGADAVKAIESGAADDVIAYVAVWCRLSGYPAAAEAAILRMGR